jgi:EAL domain-containing protein (putative c-di-GMP-specific phosphodiesterase class I)
MQPVVSWRQQATYAYEALLRTDEATLRNPADFVDTAERLGRTLELGRAVRRAIAHQVEKVPSSANVFVNIHPSDLTDEELTSPDGVLSPFASRVVLEVTERATLHEVHGLAKCIAHLRALGYRIALDDLGAGYAGLSSFALLEPDIVKVDMSLVRSIHTSPMKQKLFRSFTSLCSDLGVQIVAEGVEVPEERDCLRDLGGDLFQGYLFARPERGLPQPTF